MKADKNALIQYALNAGFTKAIFSDELSLVCRDDLRAFCSPASCHSYGHSWVCPPGCGTLQECRQKTAGFSKGLLLQSVTELMPPTAPETFQFLNLQHNLRLRSLIEGLAPAPEETLVLTTGGCVFCDSCSYPEPCRRPDVKMESLSAFGIDVADLCQSAGLPYSFRKDRVYFTAVLMIK